MIIERLHVEGFGVWTDLSLERLSDRMTVFYGPNEAGKTTLLQFLRAVLYGFTGERRSHYLPPVFGGLAGGDVSLSTTQGRFRVRRIADLRGGEGAVTIYDEQGVEQGRHLLANLFAGVDERIFNNVYAIGLRELQQLSLLEGTEAARQLYSLSTGLDRVSLVDVMDELETGRESVLSIADGQGEIRRLQQERAKLAKEIESLAHQAQGWSRLAATLEAVERDITEAEQQVADWERQRRVIEIAGMVRAKWSERRRIEIERDTIGRLPELPDDAWKRLETIKERRDQQQRQGDSTAQQRRNIIAQIKQLPINDVLWRQSARIEAVRAHEPWIAQLETQMEHLRDELKEIETELFGQQEKIGIADGLPAERIPSISRKQWSALKKPARRIASLERKVEQANAQAETSCREANDIEQLLRGELNEQQHQDLSSLVEGNGNLVTLLRRRIQLDDRLEQLQRSVEDLETRSYDLLKTQVITGPAVFWMLLASAVAVLAIFWGITGMIWWDYSLTGWALVLSGGVLGAGVFFYKLNHEREAQKQLSGITKQLELAQKQVDQVKQQRDEIDRELPPGGGPMDVRLQAAERELGEMEELMPLETQRQQALSRAENAEREAQEATDALKDAERKWRLAMKQEGLPEQLTPHQVRRLVSRFSRIGDLRDRLQRNRSALEQRRRDEREIADKIADILLEAELEPKSDDPLDQLRQLTHALDSQRQLVSRRDELRKESKQLRKQQQQHQRSARRLEHRRLALLAEAGVEDEAALRRLIDRHDHFRHLGERHEQLSVEIRTSLSGVCPEDQVAEILTAEERDPVQGTLEQQRSRVDAGRREATETVHTLHERRGRLVEQMNALVDDRRLARARFQLGLIDERIQTATTRWQQLAVTHRLLESVRQTYESDRQPETLLEASEYLSKLSSGRYVRIWTPLAKNVLRVDDEDGKSHPVEILSQGTREAIFLSLRLALANSFARRGCRLPLILDDVLVNLDTKRTQAMARLLLEFVDAGHQILVFTCHDHVREMFAELQVDVRRLPTRGQPVDAEPEEPVAIEVEVRKPVVEAPVAAVPPPPTLDPLSLVSVADHVEWRSFLWKKPLPVEPEFVPLVSIANLEEWSGFRWTNPERPLASPPPPRVPIIVDLDLGLAPIHDAPPPPPPRLSRVDWELDEPEIELDPLPAPDPEPEPEPVYALDVPPAEEEYALAPPERRMRRVAATLGLAEHVIPDEPELELVELTIPTRLEIAAEPELELAPEPEPAPTPRPRKKKRRKVAMKRKSDRSQAEPVPPEPEAPRLEPLPEPTPRERAPWTLEAWERQFTWDEPKILWEERDEEAA